MHNQSEKAQGLVEYALILILVVVIVIILLAVFGTSVGSMFRNVVSAI